MEKIISNIMGIKSIFKDWVKDLDKDKDTREIQDICMDAYLRGIQDTLEAIEGEK